MSFIPWRPARRGTSQSPLSYNHIDSILTLPQVLSMDIKPIPLPYHPSSRIRVGARDFHSPCCPTGRSEDPTLKFTYADLWAVGLYFKPVANKDGQPCDTCRHWRLIWSGPNGDRERWAPDEDEGSKQRDRDQFSCQCPGPTCKTHRVTVVATPVPILVSRSEEGPRT